MLRVQVFVPSELTNDVVAVFEGEPVGGEWPRGDAWRSLFGRPVT